MAIQISGTTVIDNSRNITNTPHVDLSGSSSLFGFDTAGNKIDSWNPESAQYGRLPIFGSGNFRVYTSPGTFCVSPGVSAIRVRVVGAGGNGGTGGCGYQTPTSPSYRVNANPGRGGGGGGYAHKCISSFPGPRTYTVTVGAAPGGTSSFGSEVSATGGSNGPSGGNSFMVPSPWQYCSCPSVSGGAGGTGVGGNVNYSGATSGPWYMPVISGQSNELTLSDASNCWKNTVATGGAAGTQLGNSSGSSVPTVPLCKTSSRYISTYCSNRVEAPSPVRTHNINRFPFDIFDGVNGTRRDYGSGFYENYSVCYFRMEDGCNGGMGAAQGITSPSQYSGLTISGPNGCSGYAAGAGGHGLCQCYPVCSNGSYNIFGSNGLNGGLGGGGGGGGGAGASSCSPHPAAVYCGKPGGSGGGGLVIVEW